MVSGVVVVALQFPIEQELVGLAASGCDFDYVGILGPVVSLVLHWLAVGSMRLRLQ